MMIRVLTAAAIVSVIGASAYAQVPTRIGAARQATGSVTPPSTTGAGTIDDSDIMTALATQEYVKLIAASLGFSSSSPPTLTGPLTVNANTTIGGLFKISGTQNSFTCQGTGTPGVSPHCDMVAGGTTPDSNVSFKIAPVGNGSFLVGSTGSSTVLNLATLPSTTLDANGYQLISLSASGTPSDVSVRLVAKGNGTVQIDTNSAPLKSSNGLDLATTAFTRDPVRCPPVISGSAYFPPFATTSAAAAPTTTNLYAQPVRFCGPLPGPVTALVYEITTAATAGTSIRLSLYADNGSGTGPSGNPLADSGTLTVATGVIGFQVATLGTPVTLPNPGLYWVVWQGNGTAATSAAYKIGSSGGFGILEEYGGYSITAGATSGVSANLSWTKTGTFGAPPSPFGTGAAQSTSTMPLIWVKF